MTIPKLRNKLKEIIILIYRFRFLTRIHIQYLLNHKNPSTINSWLSYLTTNHFIKRHYSQKFPDNIKPSVFHLDTKGIQVIRNNLNIEKEYTKKLYNEKYRSLSFETKCLNLADFVCDLLKHARKQQLKVKVLTKMDYSTESNDELVKFIQKLIPDAYYQFKGTGIAKTGFIEVIEEYKPTRVLQNKIRRYFQAVQDGDWDTVSDDKFPSLIFLLPSEKKLKSLQRAIKIVRNEFDDEDLNTELRCNLALISDIQTKSIADPIWKKA